MTMKKWPVADDDDGVVMVMTFEKNAMVMMIIKMELVMTIIIDKLRHPW